MPKAENPYIAGSPIAGERGFFDRVDILEWIEHELQTRGSSVLVLRGQRRIGKTTLLLQLKRALQAADFLPVFFNLQAQAKQPFNSILVELAETLATPADIKPRGNRRTVLPKNEDNARVFEQEFVPALLEKINPKRPVVLLDEFDVVENPTIADTLFQFFAKLTTDYPAFVFVIATGRDPADLSKDYSSIFKGSFVKEVWTLDVKSAKLLVKQAEDNKTLVFSEGVVERILDLTRCHPFLTQLLCQRLWQDAHFGHKKQDNPIPVITVEDVDISADDALTTGEMQLAWFWNGLSPSEKVYIAALAELSIEKQSISEDKVFEVLSRHAERFRTHEVEKLAPQYLVKRNILEKTGEHEYRFAIELIRRWVKNNRSLQTVKIELDQSNEPAEKLFQAGKAFFDMQRWSDAKVKFTEALSEYPNQFKSLTYLGETLIKLEEFDEAVNILEKAHRIDPDEAQKPLARALTHYAQDLHRKGDQDGALDASEKALQLSPQERNAKAIKASIWNARGDLDFEQGDLEAALDAYQRAGNVEKIQIIDESRKEERKKLLSALKMEPLLLNKYKSGSSINSLNFSHDNVLLAAGLNDGNIIIWMPTNGIQMRQLVGHKGSVNSVVFSRKEYIVASGSVDKQIILWFADIGTQIKCLEKHEDAVRCLAYSNDGKIFASGGNDKKIILWDLYAGQPIHIFDENTAPITSLCFSPTEQLLVAGIEDGNILLLEITTNSKRVVSGHSERVNSVSFSPDGNMFATSSSDANIILWEKSGTQICSLFSHKSEVTSLAFSPDGTVLASGSKDGKLVLWHINNREQIITLDDVTTPILSLAFSNGIGSAFLASSTADGMLFIWKIKSN